MYFHMQKDDNDDLKSVIKNKMDILDWASAGQ